MKILITGCNRKSTYDVLFTVMVVRYTQGFYRFVSAIRLDSQRGDGLGSLHCSLLLS